MVRQVDRRIGRVVNVEEMTRVAKPTLALNMVVLLAGMALAGATGRAAEAISLAGEWRYASDVGNAGILEQWYIGDLPAKIRLPGILQSQDYGDNISTGTPWVLSLYDRFWFLRDDYRNYTNATDVKVPFLSQPTNHFIGPAWYQREIEISPEWEGKRVSLYLERANWETRVWLDGRYVGANRSLCAPHEHDLGKVPPGTHRLFIRVDNRLQLPYRLDAHSVSDSLGQTWNGIVGKIELRATPVVWIDDAQIFADPVRKVAALKFTIAATTRSRPTRREKKACSTAPSSGKQPTRRSPGSSSCRMARPGMNSNRRCTNCDWC
jgi:hypothetical protein